MSKFVIKHIDAVKGKQQFKQLVVLPNTEDAEKIQGNILTKEKMKESVENQGELDIYEASLETRYRSAFISILAIMNRVANLQAVPKDKFRDITPDKSPVTEYEFKCKDLRVYAIKITNGQLIILGGYKNNQPADIKKFRSLKAQYLEYQNKKQ